MSEIVIWIGVLVLLFALMFLPQWQARRRLQKQIASLQPGDEVMTIGGIFGKLVQVDAEKNRARVEIAPGVEIQMLLTAINHVATPLDEAGKR